MKTVSIRNMEGAKELLTSINGEVAVMHRAGFELKTMVVTYDDDEDTISAYLEFDEKKEAA